MLFATRYRYIGDRSDASTKAMLAAFAEHGEADGTVAHYVMADGRGGLVITENDSVLESYENLLNYTQWIEFETHPILGIEDAFAAAMRKYG